MKPNDLQILDLYGQETFERLGQIIANVLALEAGQADALDPLRGEIHTLKGNSGFAGFPGIAHLCHEMEHLLATPEESGAPPTRCVTQALLDACDYIQLHTKSVTAGNPSPPVPDTLTQQFRQAIAGQPSPAAPPASRTSPDPAGFTVRWDNDTATIRIPDVTNSELLRKVIRSLHEVSALSPAHCTWIIEVSELHRLPLSLAGSLSLFQSDAGRPVHIVGLRPEIVSPAYLNRLSDCFTVRCQAALSASKAT